MKQALLLISVCIASCLQAQKEITITDNFSIEGAVKKRLTLSLADLVSFTSYSLDSIVIKNHLYEKKKTLKNIKGVLLKDILNKVKIDEENPKLLSEFYIACIASDNYKVVFSWNEIFNNDTGKSVYILTGQDGKAASVTNDRLLLSLQTTIPQAAGT